MNQTSSSLLLTLLAILSFSGCQPADPPVADDVPPGSVTFVFVMPNGETTTTIDHVAAGTLLADVMKKLTTPEIIATGSGEFTLIESIGGVANEGLRGWTFSVDDAFATAGVGATRLNPPTTVRWRYGTIEDAM